MTIAVRQLFLLLLDTEAVGTTELVPFIVTGYIPTIVPPIESILSSVALTGAFVETDITTFNKVKDSNF